MRTGEQNGSCTNITPLKKNPDLFSSVCACMCVRVCVCVASWRQSTLVWDYKLVTQQSLSLSANYRVEWCEHKHTDTPHRWHTAGTHLGHFPVNFTFQFFLPGTLCFDTYTS